MLRSIFLIFAGVVVVQVLSEETEGCEYRKLLEKCCNKKYPKLFSPQVMKECRQLNIQDKCEKDMCIVRKMNLATDDGEIDKAALFNLVKTGLASEPELVSAMKVNCFDKNIAKMGKPGMCEVAKYKSCLTSQMVENCSGWDDTGDCEGVQEKIKDFLENHMS